MNLCQEVCHTLGAPDLYNFEPLRFTTGSWDIMVAGHFADRLASPQTWPACRRAQGLFGAGGL